MFTTIKVTTLDAYGREVSQWHTPGSTGLTLADIVAAHASNGEDVIEARWIR